MVSAIIVAFYSYGKIFHIVFKSKRNVKGSSSKNDLKIYKSLFVVFGTFLLTKSPEVIVVIHYLHIYHFPDSLMRTSILITLAEVALDPLVLGLMNPEFGPKFRAFFMCKKSIKVSPAQAETRIPVVTMNHRMMGTPVTIIE